MESGKVCCKLVCETDLFTDHVEAMKDDDGHTAMQDHLLYGAVPENYCSILQQVALHQVHLGLLEQTLKALLPLKIPYRKKRQRRPHGID